MSKLTERLGFERNDSTSWDRIQSRGSNHYEDVYEGQQIERGELGRVRSTNPMRIVAVVAGIVSYVFFWCVFSLIAFLKNSVTQFTDAGGDTSKMHAGNITDQLFGFGFLKFFAAVAFALILWGVLHTYLINMVKTQNIESSTADLLQSKNDAYIQPPAMLIHNYAMYPDAGAHSAISPTSLISHYHASNKGVNQVAVAKRAPETVYDEDGDVVVYKGQELVDEKGEIITEMVPMFDEKFSNFLFDTSGLPKDSKYRIRFDPSKIDYNKDGRDRDKLVDDVVYNTAADVVNEEWTLPLYEPQRPAGAYVVDTAPVNTMVLAITRAGKGNSAPVLV